MYTGNFTVAIGPPAALEFVGSFTDEPIRAGEFFPLPPTLTIRDAGGNMLVLDSSSEVRVSISSNPNGATIGPPSQLSTRADRGVVRFSALRIDGQVSQDFSLRFSLYTFDAFTRKYSDTSTVQIVTALFPVTVGRPRMIAQVRHSDHAWAGGQPFDQQPALALMDYSGNVVVSDSHTNMTAALVHSLSAHLTRLVVDTSTANITNVVKVWTSSGNDTYGAGEQLDIFVEFEFEVWVQVFNASLSQSAAAMPGLLLNIVNVNDQNVSARVNRNYETQKTHVLVFTYIVQEGDATPEGIELNVVGDTNALIVNSSVSVIVDGNGRAVNAMLPNVNGNLSKSIYVDTSTPMVQTFTTTTESGEYGEGEDIFFFATFDHPVVVIGSPYVLINVTNATESSSEFDHERRASYHHMEDDNYTVAFLYTVAHRDYSDKLSLVNGTIIIDGGDDILRQSTNPVSRINCTIPGDLLSTLDSAVDIVINTDIPYLDPTYGVQTTSADGWYYPGDVVNLSVALDKEVSIGSGISIALLLNVGGTKGIGSATIVSLGSNNKTLFFEYVVTAGVNTSVLDIVMSPRAKVDVFGGQNYVRRKATNPTMDANLTVIPLILSNNTLKFNGHRIGVYGLPPVVQEVTAQSFSGGTVYPDDEVFLNVTFNAPVIATCDPVVVIQTETAYRNAVFHSGNGTNQWTFKYTVEVGDSSPSGFYYRHLPNALCPESTCKQKQFPHCKILARSANPSLEIDYVMPYFGRSKTLGMRVTQGIVVSPTFAPGFERDTSIVNSALSMDNGEVGDGTPLYLSLTFSDEVVINTARRPYLFTNSHRLINYFSGSGSRTLTFLLYVEGGDDVSRIELEDYPGTSSAIVCNSSCFIRNRNGDNVNTSTSAFRSLNATVAIDTSPPVVVAVWSTTQTSPYDGWYAAGQSIYIFVEFNKAVTVSTDTIAPRLRMALNTAEDRYAYYDSHNSNDTVVAFELIVVLGDYTANLEYDGIDALVKPHEETKIYRRSPYPVTEVNYTLPPAVPLGQNGHVISINATTVPSIAKVTSTTPDGMYAAGDVIDILVHFTHYVVVQGDPYINMNLGDRVLRAPHVPVNHSTDATKEVRFQYTVAPGDYNHDLDYVDMFSLRRGYTIEADRGSILQASTYPTTNASLTLPVPGTKGSLSRNSDLFIDGTEPFVTSLSFLSPAETVYGVGDVIQIQMNFSAPVYVTGRPRIALETGTYNRWAEYSSGSGTASLIYEYYPQPGDVTNKLDYAFDRVSIRSCSNSFNLTGESGDGAIYRQSANPIQPVHIHLNPLRGVLEGTTVVPAISGVFLYSNLTIPRHQGPDYEIIYSASPFNENHTTLTNREVLFNSFSNEYEMRPEGFERGDHIGWSVATDGMINVIGAPKTNMIIKDVQTVTTTLKQGTKLDAVQEVQLMRIEVDRAPEIQSFHTTADVYQTVGGTFTLDYGLLGCTRPIPANANPDMLEVILMTDLPKLGVVTVTRSPYIYCACYNAYSWNITFHDLDQGVVKPLVLDGSRLTGRAAAIIGPITLQNSSKVDGTFTLLNVNDYETDPIPYNVGVKGLIKALATIDVNAVDVQISPTNTAGSRTWTITFGAINGSYEIPLLKSNASGITGGVPTIWHTTARPGRHGPPTNYSGSGISGYFMLEWRGNITAPIPYNAEASTVELALEALEVIEDVSVTREKSSDEVGYTWIITMNRVYYNTPRGYRLDDYGPYDALIPHNHLIGTNTTIVIGSKNISRYQQYGSEVRGLYGSDSGAVYIYQRVIDDLDAWYHISTLTGNDTDSDDQFGTSVALSGDVIAVGAVGAETIGVPEIQSIFCSATEGSFTLSFRGFTSGQIHYNVTRDELENLIEGDLGFMNNLHTMHSINIQDWGGGPLCNNKSAVITFHAPVDGHEILFGEDTGSDLEMLKVATTNLANSSDLQGGIVIISELQKGTRVLHGSSADGQQTGSAYIFRAESDCGTHELVMFCNRKKWVQEAQLFPTDPLGHERYGFSVALDGNFLVVGAPGTLGGQGAVYVYKYNADVAMWLLLRKYTESVWTPERNAEFGFDVAIQGSVLVIGAPGRANNTGSAYVFQHVDSGTFVAAQEIYPPVDSFNRSEGDRLGCSIAIDGDLVVVGACGYDDSTIYLGQSPNPVARDTGAAFVFRRENRIMDYEFDQQLIPSNVRRLDNFGRDVAVHKNTILVGSVDDLLGGMVPSHTIMEIKTSADYNCQKVGNYFQLKWVRTNETGEWEQRTTRPIKKDESDYQLRLILENDLKTGPLSVTRSFVDVYDGGYVWTITFLTDPIMPISPLEPINDGRLTGTNAKVSVTVINPTPPIKRGKVHLFTRQDENDLDFEEQVYLTPFKYQRIDRFGWSVSIRDDYALVGTPNRDFYNPGQNSGAAYIFKLDFMNLQLDSFDPVVVEGDALPVNVVLNERASMSDDILYFVSTLDRNAFARRQTLIANLYSLYDRWEVFQYAKTPVDISDTAGTAIARSQFYGSDQRDHVWVDGMYDFRGLSDYVPIDTPRAYLMEYDNSTDFVTTTPDTILENLDETITVLLHAPGYWPSILGRLTSLATIEDNGDGYTTDVNGSTFFQYDKVYADSEVRGCESGKVVAVDDAIDVLVNGCPRGAVNDTESAGQVFLYKQVYGHWALFASLTSPTPTEGGLFGESIAIDTMYGRNTSTIVVGEPGSFVAHVFTSQGDNIEWTYDTTLTVPENLVVQYRFAIQGTVALHQDILLIGAPGLEKLFIFTRRFNNSLGMWQWSEAQVMQSYDFDYDIVFRNYYSHRQEYGTAVGVSGRTIAVGAPFADYDKLGSDNIEVDWHTEGTDIFQVSRGRVYLYTSEPSVQNITLSSLHQIDTGHFTLSLSHRWMVQNTTLLDSNISAELLKFKLEELENIDLVAVSQDDGRVLDRHTGDMGYYYSWAVTFLSEWEDPPLLVARWSGADCDSCEPFDVGSNNTVRIDISMTNAYENWVRSAELSAGDKRRGDRFGASLAIDGDTIAVGAVHSAAVVTTSWDFEAGRLQGWTTSGTAFDFQPTYGDNSYYHAIYEGDRDFYNGIRARPMRSRLRGRYYVGTFEKRPGDKVNYYAADPSYPQGTIQGDTPVGTMESQVFIIRGEQISFLIGGGCDPKTIYVELVVDGFSVARETGMCSEHMRRASFEVGLHKLRSAYIRVVDAEKGPWGHINVDDFQFDWDVKGGLVNDTNSDATRDMFGGQVETSRSGAVHVFHRYLPVDTLSGTKHCRDFKANCLWHEVGKLTASDKRPADRFGTSVAINERAGVIVVGAPYTDLTGFYAETPSVYPHLTPEDVSTTSGLHFPVVPQNESLFQHMYTYSSEPSGSYGVMQLRDQAGVFPEAKAYEESGAVYLYAMQLGVLNHREVIDTVNYWKVVEHSKIQPPDAFARDHFGIGVALSGSLLAVGAQGHDGQIIDSGAVYLYRAGFAAVSFAQVRNV